MKIDIELLRQGLREGLTKHAIETPAQQAARNRAAANTPQVAPQPAAPAPTPAPTPDPNVNTTSANVPRVKVQPVAQNKGTKTWGGVFGGSAAQGDQYNLRELSDIQKQNDEAGWFWWNKPWQANGIDQKVVEDFYSKPENWGRKFVHGDPRGTEWDWGTFRENAGAGWSMLQKTAPMRWMRDNPGLTMGAASLIALPMVGMLMRPNINVNTQQPDAEGQPQPQQVPQRPRGTVNFAQGEGAYRPPSP